MKQIVFVGLFLALFATSVQSPQQSATSKPDSNAGKASIAGDAGKDSIAGNAKDAKRIAIPFTVGKDHRIHLKGTINGSQPLDIIFDTGANGHVVNSVALASKKIEMVFDGTTRNGSAAGFKTVETSSSNKLTVGSLSLEDASFLSIDFGDSGFDVVLGWNAFADQAIEIDYDRKELIVHDPGNLPTDGYLKFEMRLLRGLPYIESKVFSGLQSSAASGWLEFDTGSDWSLQLSQSFATTHDLDGKLKQIGKASGKGSNGISFDLSVVVAPKLVVGDFELYQIPISISEMDPEGVEHNDILGNRLLKRFNAILDFQNMQIYLKPNGLMHSPYM